MFYLDRFMKKISSMDQIVNSEELLYFSRPGTMEIAKSIERLQRLTFA